MFSLFDSSTRSWLHRNHPSAAKGTVRLGETGNAVSQRTVRPQAKGERGTPGSRFRDSE